MSSGIEVLSARPLQLMNLFEVKKSGEVESLYLVLAFLIWVVSKTLVHCQGRCSKLDSL